MKLTSFSYWLAILIVTLANSKVQCRGISQSSAWYTGPNEQNKITNSSSNSKISSTNLPPSDRKSYDSQEPALANKQDPKSSFIRSSTTKSQNSQQWNANVPTGKGIAAEYESSTQLSGRPAGPNQNRRPSTSSKAPSRATDPQTFRNAEPSKLGTEYSSTMAERTDETSTQPGGRSAGPYQNRRPSTSSKAPGRASDAQPFRNAEPSKLGAEYSSTVAERNDNQVRTTIPTNWRAESTILTTEKWTSTPSTISTKSNSRLTTKSMTARPFVSSSSEKGSSTTAGLRSTTDSSTTRGDKSKANADSIVFPSVTTAPTSKTSTTQWLATSEKSIAVTMAATDNTTGTIENKFIYDVPEFNCPEGEKRDAEKKCRKVL